MSIRKRSIVIMGLKHCGKTTQGKKIAAKLELPFFDTDYVIEKLTGMSARELYSTKGVAAFMQAEEEACSKIIKQVDNKPAVISTGGGICDNAPALNILRSCEDFIFLRNDINDSISRITDKIIEPVPGYFENLPAYIAVEKPQSMSDIKKILETKFKERFAKYEHIADIIIDIKNAPIDDNFKTILGAL